MNSSYLRRTILSRNKSVSSKFSISNIYLKFRGGRVLGKPVSLSLFCRD